MIEPQPLQVGPFLLPLPWLVALLGIWIGAKVAERWVPSLAGKDGKWKERIVQSAVLFLLAWKWGPLLLDPVSLIQNPLSLLYSSGSTKGVWIAATVTGAYLWRSVRKEGIPLSSLLDAAAVTGLIAGIVYSLIFLRWGKVTHLPWGIQTEGGEQSYHPVHFYRALWLAGVFAGWWNRRSRCRPGETFAWIATASGIGLLFISYTDYFPTTSVLGLSRSQWLFALLAIAGWFGGIALSRSRSSQDPGRLKGYDKG